MMDLARLLQPGLHLKRWIFVALLGLVCTSLGLAYMLVHLYRVQPLPEVAGVLTLQFIDRLNRGLLFSGVGVALLVLASLKLNQNVVPAFAHRGNESLAEALYSYRFRQRGPKVVVIGGGTGLSVALRGLKQYTSNLTAIVTVADDGGSSGRLRRDMGMLPPGDFRNCMIALADVEPLMEKLLQYRFNHGSGLDGHSFGNLFIVAMAEVTGNFERALQESSRVLAVRGRVLPSTLANVTLCAEMDDSGTVHGESAISTSGRHIRHVYLQPDDPPAYPEAVGAIYDADLVVVGPGSLYTSVLPNLLVSDIGAALQRCKALKLYVCNVATQPGETEGYRVDDHVDALARHLPGRRAPFHSILANSHVDLPMPPSGKVQPVPPDGYHAERFGPNVVVADLVDEDRPVRHDSKKLAEALMRLYEDRRGAAESPHRELQEV
ncbi:MAG: uridine diphosphate-N-acetylglucosamine-binding protein YvcK [Chloroflexi bacterium]|nr:uridine diphosphate-N-acetylglucosamine-binding protein YvcK [Chloroflexota bacterium]